jgi:hypothetical protein
MRKFALCVLFFLDITLSIVSAQTSPNEDSGASNWKFWGVAGVDLALSRKTEISFEYLRAYNLEKPINTSFNQGTVSFDYDFSKKLSAKAGFSLSQFPSSQNITYKYYLRGTYKVRLGENITWSNGIQAERHSPNENRFDYRVIYLTRIGLQHRIDFLRLSPSISYWLYYNIGGSEIQHYDLSGEPTVKQSPNGFHRGRLILNLNSKVNDFFSVALFYLRQNEFNLFDKDRDINVVKPVTGKIIRPFSNYNVLGLSFLFDFEL